MQFLYQVITYTDSILLGMLVYGQSRKGMGGLGPGIAVTMCLVNPNTFKNLNIETL